MYMYGCKILEQVLFIKLLPDYSLSPSELDKLVAQDVNAPAVLLLHSKLKECRRQAKSALLRLA